MMIGICGKSCSGKSTLAKILIEKYKDKQIYIEIDKIGHKINELDVVKKELIKTFENIETDGKIDRKKLSKIVFNDEEEMQKLINITWKYMQEELDRLIEINKDKIIILDWLLLPRSKYLNMCDIRIFLDVPYEVRFKRALKRDNIKESDFKLREQSSIEYNEEDFNYILNDIDEEKMKELVKVL